jgi:hypothetical protein
MNVTPPDMNATPHDMNAATLDTNAAMLELNLIGRSGDRHTLRQQRRTP